MVPIPKIETGEHDDDFYDNHSPEQVEEIAREDEELTRNLLAETAVKVFTATGRKGEIDNADMLLSGLAAGARTLDEWKRVEDAHAAYTTEAA